MPRHSLAQVGFVLLCVLAGFADPRAASDLTWLDRVNFYRAMASLPPVDEDPVLSGAILQHARYMVLHDDIRHSEDLRDAWATPEGAAAAAVSNLAGSTNAFETDSWAVDAWMQAPFHALGILDPALRQVGFGIHRARDGRIQTAAGLDVVRGRAGVPASLAYPIVWPANGSTVPLAAHTGEYPDPLTSCQGYALPAGLPVIVQLGAGGPAPHVTGSWFAIGERTLDHCVFDEGSYRNRDATQQQLGRAILGSRHAIVLIARKPLTPGTRYRAVVEVNGRLIDWTFSVS